ncbi:prepilin-type N-terminal cleavage/methylation domain-containing protein [uncultured Ilyobacter sp.]|uniref:prepilin-type N-terminal cleavage/methylation domain-containing protein n=1 Tax=uncultured Ilyobacter sp. TaxID=544433 RepID=UPI0029BFB9D9|nr:prepilin-type N-terminal cleavage/methylation domain-containing protein [uncultured Ilyobacter sp.]
MNKKGFTVIEALVSVAILAVVFLLSSPLVKGLGMVSGRVQMQKKVDHEFAVVTKFLKSRVRSAKDNRDLSGYNDKLGYVGVFKKFKEKDVDDEEYDSKPYYEAKDFFKELETDEKKSGPILFLEIPVDSTSESLNSKFVFFMFEKDKIKYRESKEFTEADESDDTFTFDGDGWETLMNNVEDCSFQYREGIVTFLIDMDVGDYEGKIKDRVRDTVVSRIDINSL